MRVGMGARSLWGELLRRTDTAPLGKQRSVLPLIKPAMVLFGKWLVEAVRGMTSRCAHHLTTSTGTPSQLDLSRETGRGSLGHISLGAHLAATECVKAQTPDVCAYSSWGVMGASPPTDGSWAIGDGWALGDDGGRAL